MGLVDPFFKMEPMTPDPNRPPINDNPPPPLLPGQVGKCSPGPMASLLSLCLGLFLADAAVSLADDSLIVLFDLHALAAIRGVIFFFCVFLSTVVYLSMGITPLVPKRIFLPLTLFSLIALLLLFPAMIYLFDWLPQVSWVISLVQIIFALGLLCWVQGGLKFRWPLLPENFLGKRGFSGLNLLWFGLGNIFILMPVVLVYLAVCSAMAVNHFSDGFLSLRPGGLRVKVRTYVRADGKTIQLVPMSHVGESEFYRGLSESFPTNAIVLMEGVTDHQNLLTNRITYKRMASSLGLSEQQKEFKPRGEMVQADVDVAQFSTNTLSLLNLIMFVHANGMNDKSVSKLTEFVSPPHFEKELFDDLLRKRNRHLVAEINTRLADSDSGNRIGYSKRAD